MTSQQLRVISNPRPSEALNWVVRDPDEQRAYRSTLFERLLEVDPDIAFYVHFDAETGMLMMPEFASGEGARAWERVRVALEAEASTLAGREVRSFIKDDRYYRFRFHRFDDDDWAQLHASFSELPQWMAPTAAEDVARWFGINESYPPFAWGSAEDFGFEVFGVLLAEQWRKWHRRFVELAGDLPAMTSAAVDLDAED